MSANTSVAVSEPEPTQVVSLGDCATEANTLHTLIAGYARKSVEYAIRLGAILTRAKSSVAHGEWMPWVANNLQFDLRTVERYVSVYENREQIKIDNVTNLTDAYRATTSHRTGPDGSFTQRQRIKLVSTDPPTKSEVEAEFEEKWPRLFDGFLDHFPKEDRSRVVQLIDMWVQRYMYGPEMTALGPGNQNGHN